MRPGQSNKRVRGRSRRGPSPLSRSYESNGPDVKIRGTASHIAEKYMQLARDAQSAGDHVAAENYFQHAEHYFRIIAAAQAQAQQQNPNEQQQQRPRYNGADDSDGDGGNGGQRPDQSRGEGPQPPYRPQPNGEPQPVIERSRSAADAEPRSGEADVADKSPETKRADAKPSPDGNGNGSSDEPSNSTAAPAPKRRRRSATPPAEATSDETPSAEPANGTVSHDGGTDARGDAPVEGNADDKLVAAGDN